MADMAMIKRGARHAGEVGLFVDSPLFEDELATIRQGAEVSVTATQSRSLKQMRLAWGLCRKIADSGALGDADTRAVMQYILLKAKHVEYVTNVHRNGTEFTPVVKSIRFASMDQTAFTRLFDRMLWIVTTDILPDVPSDVLRDEIAQMAGVGVPEPQPKRQRKPRAPAVPASPSPASADPASPPHPEPSARQDHSIERKP